MLNQQQLQAAIVRNQARVIDLLHWTPDTYAHFMYNSGLRFLSAYIGKDEDAINQLASRKEFWNWWKMLFNARNEAFINEWDGLEDMTTVKDLVALYKDIHNPAMLAGEIHPPKVVYGQQFINIQMPQLCNQEK